MMDMCHSDAIAFSLSSSCSFLIYRMAALSLSTLRVCPREDHAEVTHATSPISQMIKVIKLFKNPKKFGLPVNPRGIRAFTSNPRGKTPKLALKRLSL